MAVIVGTDGKDTITDTKVSAGVTGALRRTTRTR